MNKSWLAAGSLAVASTIFPAFSLAQTPIPAAWPGTAASNLVVSDAAGNQMEPGVAPAPNGGVWISWLSQANGSGVAVRLQRFDMLGNEGFAHNGLLVAARPHVPFSNGYGLNSDAQGNALLAYQVADAVGSNRIAAQKIAPDGTFLWGKNGVTLGKGASLVAAAEITTTSDGNIVLGWIQDDNLAFSLLASDGHELWDNIVKIIAPSGSTLELGGLCASDNGSFIITYVRSTSISGPNLLYARKLDASGNTVWTTSVFDGGSIPSGNFPACTPDGAGGIVLTWYTATPGKHSYVQHVRADGTEAFAHNGVLVSTDAQDIQVIPALAFHPDTGNMFAFWEEVRGGPKEPSALYGQKINRNGERAWGEEGIVIKPFADFFTFDINVIAAANDSVIVVYIAYASDQVLEAIIHAARLGTDGHFMWDPGRVAVSTRVPVQKLSLASVRASNGMIVSAWESSRATTSVSDIFAQNVNVDGRLGNHTPVASDAAFTIDENAIKHGTLKATTPDGEPLVFSVVSTTEHGNLILNNPDTGAYTYVPDVGFSGKDNFTFMASNDAIHSNVATVGVTVKAVSPPPPPPDDNGGGGSLDWLILTALLGLVFIGVHNRKRCRSSE